MKFHNARGFTLIEIILAIVLASILGIFTIQFVSQIARTTDLTAGQKELVDEGKLAMEFLVRELRAADETNNAIALATPSITFDKLSAYEQDTNVCQINYDLVSNTLQRTTRAGADATCSSFTGSTTTTLASGVTSFTIVKTATGSTFYYVITMELTGSEGNTFQLETAVRPRSTIS